MASPVGSSAASVSGDLPPPVSLLRKKRTREDRENDDKQDFDLGYIAHPPESSPERELRARLTLSSKVSAASTQVLGAVPKDKSTIPGSFPVEKSVLAALPPPSSSTLLSSRVIQRKKASAERDVLSFGISAKAGPEGCSSALASGAASLASLPVKGSIESAVSSSSASAKAGLGDLPPPVSFIAPSLLKGSGSAVPTGFEGGIRIVRRSKGHLSPPRPDRAAAADGTKTTPPRVRRGIDAVLHMPGSGLAQQHVKEGVAELATMGSPDRRLHGAKFRRKIQRAGEMLAGIRRADGYSPLSPPRRKVSAAATSSSADMGAGIGVRSPERRPVPRADYHDRVRLALKIDPRATELRALHADLSKAGVPIIGSPVHAKHILAPNFNHKGITGFHYCRPGSAMEGNLSSRVSNAETGVFFAILKLHGCKKWSSFFPQSIRSEFELLELFGRKTRVGRMGDLYLYELPTGVHFVCISGDEELTYDTMYPLFHVCDYKVGEDLSFKRAIGSNVKQVTVASGEVNARIAARVTEHLKNPRDKGCFVVSKKSGSEMLCVDITLTPIKGAGMIFGGVWVKVPLSALPSSLAARFLVEKLS